ncbi:MAG: hypothetical protein WC893_00715 [Candidatus Paceibacterota bacterium]|jgi:hypothetical protein
MTKKTLLIILIIIIFITLDVIFYVFFFQNRDSLKTQTQSPGPVFPISDNRSLEKEDVESDIPDNQGENSDNSIKLIGETTENNLSFLSIDNLSALSLSAFKIGTTTKIFIFDKPSGNIFEYTPSEGLNRLTNTTFPRVEEVVWGLDKNGLRLILRRSNSGLFNNTSGLIKLTKTGEIKELETNILSDNLLSFTVSPQKDKVFVINGRQGGIDGYIADFNLNNQKKIFSSPLSEWSICWPNPNYITFQTKPSFDVPGHLFFLNINNGSFEPILRNIEGLLALVGPNANKIIYSRNTLDNISTYLYDYKLDKSFRLSLSTFPEKCVWNEVGDMIFCAVPKNITKANYPDDWYQGKVRFDDNLWVINASNGNVNLITDNQMLGDLINLKYNKDQNEIFAIDRNSKKIRIISLNN